MQLLFRRRPATACVFRTTKTTQAAVQHSWPCVRSGSGSSSSNSSSSSSTGSSSAREEELHRARAWLAALHADVIPLKIIGELSFSRSSGPGGQNVNK